MHTRFTVRTVYARPRPVHGALRPTGPCGPAALRRAVSMSVGGVRGLRAVPRAYRAEEGGVELEGRAPQRAEIVGVLAAHHAHPVVARPRDPARGGGHLPGAQPRSHRRAAHIARGCRSHRAAVQIPQGCGLDHIELREHLPGANLVGAQALSPEELEVDPP